MDLPGTFHPLAASKLEKDNNKERELTTMARTVTLELQADIPTLLNRLAPFVALQKNIFDLTNAFMSGVVYLGTFSHQGFTLRRRINYRNSFLPTARGVFRPGYEGTTVELSVAPMGWIVGFSAFILGIFAVSGLALLVIFLMIGFDGDFPVGMLGLPLGFLALPALFGGIFYASYRYEASKAISDLTKILHGTYGPAPVQRPYHLGPFNRIGR